MLDKGLVVHVKQSQKLEVSTCLLQGEGVPVETEMVKSSHAQLGPALGLV
jgi:hypothetical protein